MLSISVTEKQIISDILQKYLPDYQISAFGSRVTGQNHPFSPSDLPYRVDLLDGAVLTPDFRKLIAEEQVSIN